MLEARSALTNVICRDSPEPLLPIYFAIGVRQSPFTFQSGAYCRQGSSSIALDLASSRKGFA